VADPESPVAAGDAPPPPHAEGPHARDPIAAFREALERARKREPVEATSVVLATADAEGRPSARVVLLKGVDERGFVFYTNLGSRKSRQLAANPSVALVFRWERLQRQVCVTGSVEPTSREESEAYFRTRPREARIGAWASRQSEVLASRAELEARYALMDARFPGEEVPLPPFWGGFRVIPETIEFWQGREHRLHDRFRYAREEGAPAGWRLERLSP
jgi:pyridoxamine 5'-phosphate oxidase